MKLRTKYVLFVSLIHIALIILSLNLIGDKIILFLVAEIHGKLSAEISKIETNEPVVIPISG
ncbi:MAG: hypothetical protein P9L95_05715 [Candidatus Tenebribacter mawsonii]|nr:hypothetical protein [Candidatus Tenebribacter mawsonii]